MLSRTLSDGLGEYGIGAKVRTLRLKKKMGLVELGLHTGLSAAMLSKLERGRLFPTLPTLLRIALVFGVGLEYFFTGPRDKPLVAVVRKAERVRLPERPGGGDVSYTFESLDFPATERRFNSYLATFGAPQTGKAEPHTHEGAEFVYVLSGSLALTIAGEEHVLETGDTVYFDGSLPHTYRRAAGRECIALVVTAP
jgi:transcriptional regulator with XRE-family HTH domain